MTKQEAKENVLYFKAINVKGFNVNEKVLFLVI